MVTVNCRERKRLLEERMEALKYFHACERVRVKDKLADAHRMCRDTMAALQTHLLLHGCGGRHAMEGRRQASVYNPSRASATCE